MTLLSVGYTLIALTACVLPAHAAVDINDHVERYTIEGATPPELRREMSAKGPQGKEGQRFDGHTRWYVSWRYQYKNTAGGCAIASVTTSVKATITLPQWSYGRVISPRWTNMSRDIAVTAWMPPTRSILR